MANPHPSVDPETIAKTKQQIRTLVAEIEQLSKSITEPQKYYEEYLQRLVTADRRLRPPGVQRGGVGGGRRPELDGQRAGGRQQRHGAGRSVQWPPR